jgi:taurine dioxygenase
MATETITVTPLTPGCGALIGGVDLAQDLGNQQFQEIHEALMRHTVVFFRDQHLTVEQHKDFGRRFGKLHVHPNARQDLEGHPEILVIKADAASTRVAGETWHSDVSCDPEPPMGSILYIQQAPDGGDTMFANMVGAYESLSPPIQALLEGLTAVHDSAKAHSYRRTATDRSDVAFPSAEHPIVRTHPVTGRRALFVNRGFTTHIPQLKRHESEALLDEIWAHAEDPAIAWGNNWRIGDLVLWDNRCTMHRRDPFPAESRRVMHRTQVKGAAPPMG